MDNDNLRCTVPVFENKQHVCTNEVKAEWALKIYQKYERKRIQGLQPCNYLKAYLTESSHNQDARIILVWSLLPIVTFELPNEFQSDLKSENWDLETTKKYTIWAQSDSI